MQYEIVIDRGESANKCTIAPLSYREDFNLLRVKGNSVIGPLVSTVLLHHEGDSYENIQRHRSEISGIACIDCIWRRLNPILAKVQGPLPRLMKIPDGFKTAYPRKSELDHDPEGGLATIEAIFIAAALFGKWDVTLLHEYYFGKEFIDLNAGRMRDLGIYRDERPIFHPRENTSKRRKEDRKILW